MDQVQTQATPTTSADWDYFIQQMDKIAILQNRVNFTDNRIDATQDEIIEIKEFITGEEQGELDQKNVIDNKKLPGTLTINQKKRYEQIGKQFVAGAGRQFERIKNAIETKQKMKTDENSIRKEIDKAKQSSKKMTKGNGFWKKLLAVLAILSMVTFIFKDKLIKMLPDMSNGIEGVGDSIYTFLRNTITGMVLYSQKLVGGTMSSVINYICKEILPGTIGTFFNDTLPTALVVATLSVMSMLSDSAGKQLEAYLNDNVSETQSDVINTLQQQANGTAIDPSTRTLTVENINGWDKRSAELAFATFGETLWNQAYSKGGEEYTNSIFHLLDEAADKNGDVDLRDSDYNITPLLQTIHSITQRETDEAKRGMAINEAIKASLQAQNINTDGMDFTDLHAGLITAANQMANDDRYKALQTRLNLLNSAKVLPADAKQQIQPVQFSAISVKNVEIEDVMMNLIAQQTSTILASLDSFLNGKSDETLFEGVTTYMTNLNEQTNLYFSKVMDLLSASLVRGLHLQIPNQNTSGNNSSGQSSSFSFKVGDNSNVSIINVNIQDTFTTQFSAITDLQKSQTAVIGVIQTTNTILNQVNENLGYGLFIQHIDDERLKTEVARAADSFDKRISKNAEDIKNVNARVTKLHTPKTTPTPSSGTPNGATPSAG